jgi:hypothetical protein
MDPQPNLLGPRHTRKLSGKIDHLWTGRQRGENHSGKASMKHPFIMQGKRHVLFLFTTADPFIDGLFIKSPDSTYPDGWNLTLRSIFAYGNFM